MLFAVIIIVIIVTVIVVVYIKCFSLKHLKSEIYDRMFKLGVSPGGSIAVGYLESVEGLLNCDKQSLGGLSLILDVVEEAKGVVADNFVGMFAELAVVCDIPKFENVLDGFAQLFKTKDSSGDTLFDAEAAQGFVRLISSKNKETEKDFLYFLTRGLACIIGGISESEEKVFNEVAARGFISLLKVDNAIFVENFANFLNKFSQGGKSLGLERTKPYICEERVAKMLSNEAKLKKFVEKLSDENFDVINFLNKLRVENGFSFGALFQELDTSSNLNEDNISNNLDNDLKGSESNSS